MQILLFSDVSKLVADIEQNLIKSDEQTVGKNCEKLADNLIAN